MGGKSSVPVSSNKPEEPTPSLKPVMVAAIDFGTTYSGYAFAFNDEPENIILNRNWGAEFGFSSLKTPTSVLVNPKGECESFGYMAERDYAQKCSDKKREQYELYRHFKMTLYTDKDLRRSTMVRSVRGNEFSLMKLTEFILSSLKAHLLEAVSKSNTNLDEKKIQWVLTVPAIWHEDAKQFMRQAALQADLIEEQYSDRLILALEPEAASVFCRSLDVDDFNEELPIKKEDVKFEIGTKYFIADIGGGTLDISAHEIQSENELVEIITANGGDLGGKKLNDSFESLLIDLLGEKFVSHLRKDYPHLWLELTMQYEYKKRGVTADDKEGIDIDINSFIKEEFKRCIGKELDDVINKSALLGVEYSQGTIDVEQKTVKKLFDPVIDNINSCIEKSLENEALHGFKYLILVGGFGDSPYLLHKIEKAFKNTFSFIISPAAANSVILKGAVRFGQQPATITSRKCRKTYGIGTDAEFVEGRHKNSKKYKKSDGRWRSKDVFKPYVLKGEQVAVNTFKTHMFTSAKKDISISIYCTDRTDVVHTDEEGVTKVDELTLKKPFLKRLFSSERIIESRIYFGKTEITVDLEDKKTGQIVKTSIDFLKE